MRGGDRSTHGLSTSRDTRLTQVFRQPCLARSVEKGTKLRVKSDPSFRMQYQKVNRSPRATSSIRSYLAVRLSSQAVVPVRGVARLRADSQSQGRYALRAELAVRGARRLTGGMLPFPAGEIRHARKNIFSRPLAWPSRPRDSRVWRRLRNPGSLKGSWGPLHVSSFAGPDKRFRRPSLALYNLTILARSQARLPLFLFSPSLLLVSV